MPDATPAKPGPAPLPGAGTPPPEHGGATTVSLPSVGSSSVITRASRIITIDRSNFFLHCSMVAVLANVLLPWWLTLPMLLVFMLWLGIVWAYSRGKITLPERLMEPAENLIDRVQSHPGELIVAGTLVLVTGYRCSQRQIAPDMSEVAIVLLMLMALAMCRNSRMPGGFNPSRTPWKRAKKIDPLEATQMTQTRAEPDDPQSPASGAAASDSTRMQWEAKQRHRWEEWIAEEVTRLADDRERPSAPQEKPPFKPTGGH